jgi:hypothetical protein
MPKTIEVEVFKWEELSQTAKDRVRDWYIEGMNYDWWEGVYEMAIEDGKEKGFYIDKIFFSGFWSQGDGASWTGFVDVRQWLEAHEKDSIGLSAWCALVQEDVVSKHIQVRRSGRYYHEGTMDVGYVEDDTDGFEDDYTMQLPSIFKGMEIRVLFDLIATDPTCNLKTVEDITTAITDSAKDYARHIYKRLEEEYEYLTSEEAVAEACNANDYQFNEEGEIA